MVPSGAEHSFPQPLEQHFAFPGQSKSPLHL